MESISPRGSTGAERIRLLVVDDDDGIRTLLEVTISLDPRFELLATAATAADALERIRELEVDVCPDVVLLDVTLPDRDGIELLGDLRAVCPASRIALFTGWSDDETITRATQAGADAVFRKDGDPRGLLDSIARLAAPPGD